MAQSEKGLSSFVQSCKIAVGNRVRLDEKKLKSIGVKPGDYVVIKVWRVDVVDSLE